MQTFAKENLDAMWRQIEDDYRLDIGAIERLRQRFGSLSNGAETASPSTSHSAPQSMVHPEPASSVAPSISAPVTQSVDLTSTPSSSPYSGEYKSMAAGRTLAPEGVDPRTGNGSHELGASLRAMFSGAR